MRIIAAYLLAVLGGNASPDEKAIKKILSAVDIKADDARVTEIVEKLKGKDLDALLEEGKKKIGASAPSGGSSAAPSGGDDKKDDKSKKGKEKEPEPEKVEEEEVDVGMGGLFD